MQQLTQIMILAIFICFSNILEASAQKWYKLSNIVKIRTSLSNNQNENGFGFVVYEKNDSLFIVTAKHVIQSEKAQINVTFYNDSIDQKAYLVQMHPTLDIALIKTANFNIIFGWEFRGNTKTPKSGDKIEIVGRYDNWSPISKRMKGVINQTSENSFIAGFYGAAAGSSGGPVLSKNQIVGMIINDAGGQIIAIPIQTIEKTVHEWLKVKSDSIKDLPLIDFGFNVRMSTRQITPGRYELLMDKSNEFISFRPGIYFEISPFKKTSFGFDANYRKVYKTTKSDYVPEMQFKNKYFSYSFSLNYNFFSNLSDPFAFSDVKDFFLQKLILGYSWNSMNPKIKIENSDWALLENQLGVLPGYSKNFSSFFVGFGSNNNFEKYAFKVEVIYEHFLSKYLLMDIVDPLNSNVKNDWMLSVNFKFGFMFRPKSSGVKLLR